MNAPRVRRTTLAVSALLVALSGCATPSKPTTPAAPSSAPATPAAKPTSSRSTLVSTDDLNTTPKPGEYCATSRLNKTFVKDGVTYRCGGEKPYRWRRV